MKKLALTIAIVLGLGLTTFADEGGLFKRGAEAEASANNRGGGAPMLPNHGEDTNQNAPLGSGIAVLLGMGGAYLLAKRREE